MWGKCGKVCCGVRESEGRFGVGVGKCVGMCGKIKSIWGECGEVCWGVEEVSSNVGKGMRGVGES